MRHKIRFPSFKRTPPDQPAQIKGFDDYDLRLGDLLRGERATLGKTLLDVQYELRIKADYIAAIEDANPSAFESQGFIAGYVRSYARYLGLNPDDVFESFCYESGFITTRELTSASKVKPKHATPVSSQRHGQFDTPKIPYVPQSTQFFETLNPGAVGSLCVMGAILVGLGYGAWNMVEQIQRVQLAPVERAPHIYASIEQTPLARDSNMAGDTLVLASNTQLTQAETLDNLYRPQALDAPVMTPRDAAISTLTPYSVGHYRSAVPPKVQQKDLQISAQETIKTSPLDQGLGRVQVVAKSQSVQLAAVRPAWVRVRSAANDTLYQGIMEPGEYFAIPASQDPATLRIGESSAVYFVIDGSYYGPVGPRGQVTSNVPLSAQAIQDSYALANPSDDQALQNIANVALLDVTP